MPKPHLVNRAVSLYLSRSPVLKVSRVSPVSPVSAVSDTGDTDIPVERGRSASPAFPPAKKSGPPDPSPGRQTCLVPAHAFLGPSPGRPSDRPTAPIARTTDTPSPVRRT